MKKVTMIVSILICMLIAVQSTQAQEKGKSKFDNWPELKTFHGVMSQTFHPSEEGNLKPIKERSGEMAEKADKLAQSKIPSEFDKKEVKEAVNKLAADSKALDALIKKKGSDEEIKKALAALHDTFHLIVERCQKGEEHGGEEHHHHEEKK